MNTAHVLVERASTESYRFAFLVTTFLGGLLLFTLQPMIARMALPRLGGTPAVWNSAMLSYQVLLLGGYACAYLLSRLSAAQQVMIYIGLLIVASFWLPVGLLVGDPPTNSNPIFWVPWLIIASIGPPFFILAAQAPLLQNWYGKWTGREPYHLYVASSLGNFVGLLLYPFVLEPFLSIRDQRNVWSCGFGVFGLLIAVCAAFGMRKSNTDQSVQIVAPQPKRNFKRLAQWTLIAAVPSGLILSTTLHLTTDIVAMPLIWIVPLGLYLLSFSLAFSNTSSWPIS